MSNNEYCKGIGWYGLRNPTLSLTEVLAAKEHLRTLALAEGIPPEALTASMTITPADLAAVRRHTVMEERLAGLAREQADARARQAPTVSKPPRSDARYRAAMRLRVKYAKEIAAGVRPDFTPEELAEFDPSGQRRR